MDKSYFNFILRLNVFVLNVFRGTNRDRVISIQIKISPSLKILSQDSLLFETAVMIALTAAHRVKSAKRSVLKLGKNKLLIKHKYYRKV